jgi:hypothetical protein
MYWDKEPSFYTSAVYKFGSLFQHNFALNDIGVSVQGVHYLNKHQQARDTVISVIPMGFVKQSKPQKGPISIKRKNYY